MFERIWQWFIGLFDSSPIRLAIVRRYIDANGAYIGELYIERAFNQASAYCMVGVSLDTLSLDFDETNTVWGLDTRNDFLVPMPASTIRVGALLPIDNDRVRVMIGKMPRHRISLVVQNRFIECVLEGNQCQKD